MYSMISTDQKISFTLLKIFRRHVDQCLTQILEVSVINLVQILVGRL